MGDNKKTFKKSLQNEEEIYDLIIKLQKAQNNVHFIKNRLRELNVNLDDYCYKVIEPVDDKKKKDISRNIILSRFKKATFKKSQ